MKKRNQYHPNLKNMSAVDLINLKNKIGLPFNKMGNTYVEQYNSFWFWKLSVEQYNNGHILDAIHLDHTCKMLIGILPKWQTYRGVKCNYKKMLPTALYQIAGAYSEIRNYSLLEFHKIPDKPLRLIWDTLGSVKEQIEVKRSDLNYFTIAICKPLMFLWGQTLAFDSINRRNIQKDTSLQLSNTFSAANRWTFPYWKIVMLDFQKALLQKPEIIKYCQLHSFSLFGSNSIIPYGRYLDLCYY